MPSTLPTSPERRIGRSRAAGLLAAFLCLLFVVVHLYRFPGAGRDDVFLTIWAGETLGVGPWFVNFNFEPEEMSTSVLGSLIVAGLRAIAPDATYLLNKVVSFLAGALLLVVLWRGRRLLFDVTQAEAAALLAVAATALSPVYGYWALSGLESTLYGLLLLLYVIALAAYDREPESRWCLAAAIGVQILLILVRAEGFWTVIVTAGLWTLAPSRRRWSPWVVLAPAAFFAILIGLRYAATGLVWPNSVYAKTGDFARTVPKGFAYLGGYYSASLISAAQFTALVAAIVVLTRAAAGWLRSSPQTTRVPFVILVTSALVVGYELFVVSSGGNWMEYYRFVVPSLALKNVLLAWLVLGLAARASARIASARSARASAVAAVFVFALATVAQQAMSPVSPIADSDRCSESLPLRPYPTALGKLNATVLWLNCAQRRDDLFIAPFVRKHLREYIPAQGHLNIVTYQGGYFPYYVRKYFGVDEVYFYGTQGLMNREVAIVDRPKDSRGFVDGPRVDRILGNQAGELSKMISPQGPILIYKIGMRGPELTNLQQMGFREVWKRPGARVLYRD